MWGTSERQGGRRRLQPSGRVALLASVLLPVLLAALPWANGIQENNGDDGDWVSAVRNDKSAEAPFSLQPLAAARSLRAGTLSPTRSHLGLLSIDWIDPAGASASENRPAGRDDADAKREHHFLHKYGAPRAGPGPVARMRTSPSVALTPPARADPLAARPPAPRSRWPGK